MNAPLPRLTSHCFSRPELFSLDWCDQMLEREGNELDHRERLARASHQDTISLTLCAQRVMVERLRTLVRRHFWDVRNGLARP